MQPISIRPGLARNVESALRPCLLILIMMALQARADRLTLSLDGVWQIADSTSATALPESFSHTVAVPGLANLARPAFPNVDAFSSREHLANLIRSKLAPEEWLTNYWAGKVDQERNYFWYEKEFRAPAQKAVALLRINKAQFGTAVWLNGQKLGDYAGCFTASHFSLGSVLKWSASPASLRPD